MSQEAMRSLSVVGLLAAPGLQAVLNVLWQSLHVKRLLKVMAERGWWVRGRTACLTLRARTACRQWEWGVSGRPVGLLGSRAGSWAAVGQRGRDGEPAGPGQPPGSRCTGSEAWAMWGWKWLQSRKLVRKALLQTWQAKGFTEHSSSWCRSSCLGAGKVLPHFCSSASSAGSSLAWIFSGRG